MNTSVEVVAGRILLRPSFADLLLCQRLGERFRAGSRAWEFPATPDNARLIRNRFRDLRTTPEFDALLSPVAAAVNDHCDTTPAEQVVANAEALIATSEPPPHARAEAQVAIVPEVPAAEDMQNVALATSLNVQPSPPPEPDVTVPHGILTAPWRHQKAAFKFCQDKFAAGFHGLLLAMGMGCVGGDAELIINRRHCARRIALREFHRKFHGGESNGRRWRDYATRTRSMIDGELHLNDVVDVVAQGIKPVVRITLASGKFLRVTADHEIACPDGVWIEAGKLVPGHIVLTNGVPACKSCGGTRRVTTYRYAKHVGICRSCIGKSRRVKGKVIDKDGYVRLYRMQSHPRANKAGQVYEHIVVMEQVLGRPITASEHVHHKNQIRHDNRPENLEVLPVAEHHRHHGRHGAYLHLDGGKVHFVPKPDTVISAEPDGETDVYDIRMAGPGHNFVANGIVVHNCGKSLVACMLLLAIGARRTLIACPLRVIQVWVTQFERHVGIPVVIVPLGDDIGSVAKKQQLAMEKLELARVLGRPFVAVINYDSLWRDPFAAWAEKVPWDAIIGDELHRAKSPSSKVSLGLKRLRLRARYRLGLTGTPMPHGPMDIYALYRFLDIRIFGPSFSAFRAKYAVMGGYQGKQVTGYQHLDELEALMGQIMFRVGSEVLDLPPATEVTYHCVLTGEAARIYRDLEEEFVARVKDGTVTAAKEVKVLRLEQVTGGCVPTDEGAEVRVDSTKLRLLADTIEDIGDQEPMVVFCWFHADLDGVHEACVNLGLHSLELSGRRDELKRWQNGDAQVLAVQIASGSEGVDLTRARYSIFYSIGYRLDKYEQAKKRTHRPGQTKPVTHIHLIARNTVDVKIMRALERRADIVESILREIKN